MESRKLFSISFFINFVFSMLTALLSLIMFNINHSTRDISITMITFMSSLLIIRLLSFSNLLKPRAAIIVGSILFAVGCFIFVVNSGSMTWMFVGAIMFGTSIGLIPPAILVLLSADEEKRDSNLGIYNAIVAIASIFSPLIGESLYNTNSSVLFISWFILALAMSAVSLLLKRGSHNETEMSATSMFHNLKTVMSNKLFQISFIVLSLSSISYGSVVSYLPVYFESIKSSIGIYYLFFWSGYILVQFLKEITYSFKIILFALLAILLGQVSLAFINVPILLYFFSFIYGLVYGSLFKVFYVGIGNFESEEERNIGFSTIGLISYIGVGIAPIFLIPFNNGWALLFSGNIFYSALALALFLVLYFWRKYSDDK